MPNERPKALDVEGTQSYFEAASCFLQDNFFGWSSDIQDGHVSFLGRGGLAQHLNFVCSVLF